MDKSTRKLLQKAIKRDPDAFTELMQLQMEEMYANVKHFFTSLGNEFFTSSGKQFFTLFGNEFFSLYGKQFFTLPGKEFFTSSSGSRQSRQVPC